MSESRNAEDVSEDQKQYVVNDFQRSARGCDGAMVSMFVRDVQVLEAAMGSS